MCTEKLEDMHQDPKSFPVDCKLLAAIVIKLSSGYDAETLSIIGGISSTYMKKLIKIVPCKWPAGVLGRICDELGLKQIMDADCLPEDLR